MQAADALGDIGPQAAGAAVPALTAVIASDSNPWVVRNAVEALGYLGENSTAALTAFSANCCADC